MNFSKRLIATLLTISLIIPCMLTVSPAVFAETVSDTATSIQYRSRSKIYKVSEEELPEPWILYDTKSGSEHTGMRSAIADWDDSEEMSAMYSACKHKEEIVNKYVYNPYGTLMPGTYWYGTEEEFQDVKDGDWIHWVDDGELHYRYTYCTSIDYYTDYYYYMWSDWTAWGDTVYTPDDDTEVETREVYTITYDANGGVATPDEQFKIMDEELRLASTLPTRDEYVFMGWATSSTGEVEYNAGDAYYVNANATLYAVWKPISDCETIKTYYRYSYKIYEEPTTEWRGEYWLYKTETKYEHGDFEYVIMPSVGYSTVGYCIHDKIYVNKYVNKYNSGQWFYATPSEFMNMDGTTVLSYAPDNIGYYKFQYCTSKTPYEVYYYYSWSDWSNWTSTPINETDDVIVETKTVALFPITYDANGGSGVPAQQYKKSDENITLTSEIPTRENHLFLGWSTSPEGNVEYAPGTEYFANADITLYAVWQNMTKYTITYDANGGTGAPTPQTNTYGESTEISSEIPMRENHQFLGWTTSAGGSVEYTPGSQYSNNVDVTLYAVWKNLSKYTITYDANGGLNAPVEQIKPHAENITLSTEIPTRENHQFLGWATSADGKVKYLAGAEYSVNANITLYAVWEKIYTITYDANGGSDAPASQTKTHDVDFTLSNSKPTKEGFTFIGWATSSEGNVAYQAGDTYSNNENITLYAQWKVTEYTITYDANGGSNAPASQTKTHDIDFTLSNSKPTKEGFTFIGWATSSEGNVAYQAGDTYSNNENITLYAQWKVTEYTITYDANGGSNAPDSQTKTHDVDLTLSNSKPTKDGHTFIGWAISVDGNVDYQSGDTYTTNESVKLFAKWDINTYTITFDANGGNEAPASQVKTYGTDLVLSSNIPFRTGYTFQGWSTTKEGVVEYLAGGIYSLESNNTLYAIWGTGVSEIASGECGENITWILYNDGTLAIDGTGGMYNYKYGNDPWDGNKSNIKHIEISEGVTRIGDYAFYGCSRFSTIDLPNTLTGIGEKSFSYCSGLVNITLPGNLKWIDRYAFSTCSNLSSIIIPDTVQQIREHAFENCRNMTSIRLPSYLQYPYIHEHTFDGCSSLTDVTLPENLEHINMSAFYGCTSLKTVTVPKTVTYIGDDAFYGCRNLATIYYEGTSEEWEAIRKGTDWDYNAGKDTTKKTYEVTRGTYVISYDANGGEGAPLSQTKTQGVEMSLSDVIPTRTGYIFHGWSTIPNGSVEYQAGDLYTKNFDTILYALWRNPYTYTISYDANNGVGVPEQQTKTEGVGLKLSEIAPTRTGYLFSHWSTETPLSFEGLKGSSECDDDLDRTWTISCPDAVSISLSFSSDTSFKYDWVYLRLYDCNGKYIEGYTGTELASETVTVQGDAVTIKTWGEIETSWYFEVISAIAKIEYNPGDVCNIDANTSLTAVWELDTYTVSYDACGGNNAPQTQIKTHSIPLTLSAQKPTRTGYIFLGWSRTANGNVEYEAGDTLELDNDITLYAVWRDAIIYTITYDANGGIDAPESQKKTEGVNTILSKNVPTRIGHSFSHWAKNKNNVESIVSLSVSGIESKHSYANNENSTWTISHPGAKSIALTFDERTELESNYDFLYLYNSEGTCVGEYTGTKLAGKTITVNGDSITLKLTSDYMYTKWGFAVISATANILGTYSPGDSYDEDGNVTLYAIWDVCSHHWNSGVITLEPTCKTVGIKTFTCTECDETKTEEIPKTSDHSYGSFTKVDGDNHKHICSVCDNIETLEHTWDDGMVTATPTHTTYGVKTFTCSDCNATKTEDVAKLTTHTYGGWQKHNTEQHKKVCECGDVQYDDHNWDAGVVTTQPTHNSFGVKTFTCADCTETKNEDVAKTTEHSYGKWTKVDDETHKRSCICGDEETESHNWDSGTVTTAPTHTSFGVRTHTCKDCSATKTEDVAKTTEHSYGKWSKVDNETHKRSCICGNEETESHNWDSGVVTVTPTHTTFGERTFTCSDCSATKTEKIAKTTEHSYGKWTKVDVTNHSRACVCGDVEIKTHTWDDGEITTPPTQISFGVITYTCSDCLTTKTEDLPMISGSISGTVKSFGDETASITIELVNESGVLDTKTAVENNGTYSFSGLTSGTYTVRVSKSKHCTREYEVIVSDSDVTLNLEIWLYGDVNADGTVNHIDVLQINRNIASQTSVFDAGTDELKAYRFNVANVTAINGSDTELNHIDVLQINRKIANLTSIFDSLQ